MQTGIKISGDKISGTLKYVSGYTGFNGVNEEEQSGNFIALQFEPTPEDATVTVEIVGGTSGSVELTDDMQWVGRITNNATQKIKATVTSGKNTTTKTYDLTGLTLQPQAAKEKRIKE